MNLNKIKFDHSAKETFPELSIQKIRHIPFSTYIALDPISRLCKIGKTKSLKTRLQRLNNQFKTTLIIIALFYDDYESEMHEKYKNYRVFGEWFFLSNRLIQEIQY